MFLNTIFNCEYIILIGVEPIDILFTLTKESKNNCSLKVVNIGSNYFKTVFI